MTDAKYSDPEKPPFSCCWILMACPLATPAALKVWMRMWPLDGSPKGCYATAELLASLLALSPERVDDTRRWLAKAGLLERVPGGWKVRFPRNCWPDSAKPPFEVVKDLARKLDLILGQRFAAVETRAEESGYESTRPRENTGLRSRSSSPQNPVPIRDLVRSITSGAPSREGGRGESSPLHRSLKGPRLSLPLMTVQEGGKGDGVADADENGREGASGLDSPEWQAAKEAARRAAGGGAA